MGRKTFRIELNCTPEQALGFDVFTALARDVSEIRKHVRVVGLQFQRVLKIRDSPIVLSFSATRVTKQEIEVCVLGIALQCLRKDFARALVTLTTNIRHAETQVVNELTLRLLECL